MKQALILTFLKFGQIRPAREGPVKCWRHARHQRPHIIPRLPLVDYNNAAVTADGTIESSLSRGHRGARDKELDYLWETLGLEITAVPWPDRDKIHATLRPAITVLQAKYRRASFLIMRTSWHAGLPDLKRIQASLVELSGMPTVISEAHLEQRQRDRLQAQRIPFICPGVQAYLPFMDEEYWSGTPNKHVKVYEPHEWAQLED